MNANLTFVIGCTGCGKGALGRELARRINAEIISLDSMKVYRRMDIGTAKPTVEQRQEVPHHLVDVVEPYELFSVADYVEQAEQAIADINGRGRPIVVLGGTPMYFKALTEGLFEGPGADEAIRVRLRAQAKQEGLPELHRQLIAVDPKAAQRIHPHDERRIIRALEVFELMGKPISEIQTQWDREDRDRCRYESLIFGLRRQREDQNHRTNQRVKRMLDRGLLDEVKSLLAEPLPLSSTASKAVGYAEIIEHIHGGPTLDDAVERIKINTRQLAKSQRTWFRRFEHVEWVDLQPESTVEIVADDLVTQWECRWSA